jgi:hypothetical protein
MGSAGPGHFDGSVLCYAADRHMPVVLALRANIAETLLVP